MFKLGGKAFEIMGGVAHITLAGWRAARSPTHC